MKLWRMATNADSVHVGAGPSPTALSSGIGISMDQMRQPEGPALLHFAFQKSRSVYRWLQDRRALQANSKRMRVVETLSLGERRFVSILNVDGVQFLIGGTSTSVQLLAALENSQIASEAALAETEASR